MFKPREAFVTVEHFADHIADTVASIFRSTKAKIESDIAIMKGELEDDFRALRAELSEVKARLARAEHDLSHPYSSEVATSAVHLPPAAAVIPENPAFASASVDKSQEENAGAGSSPEVTEGLGYI